MPRSSKKSKTKNRNGATEIASFPPSAEHNESISAQPRQVDPYQCSRRAIIIWYARELTGKAALARTFLNCRRQEQ